MMNMQKNLAQVDVCLFSPSIWSFLHRTTLIVSADAVRCCPFQPASWSAAPSSPEPQDGRHSKRSEPGPEPRQPAVKRPRVPSPTVPELSVKTEPSSPPESRTAEQGGDGAGAGAGAGAEQRLHGPRGSRPELAVSGEFQVQ